MKKSSPVLVIAIGVGVLIVGCVVAWSVLGGKKTSAKEVEDLKAEVAPSAATDGMTAKERLEHIRRTRAAMAKYDVEEKQRVAADEAKKQAEEEEKKKAAAAKSGGGGPAPVSGAGAKKAGDSLDSLGSDYASQF